MSTTFPPLGYSVQPFVDGVRAPAQLVIRPAAGFSDPGAAPLWTFAGDDSRLGDGLAWNAINGFVFRRRGETTIALIVNAKGHCVMVPVVEGARTRPADACWQPPSLLPDNPHSVEYVPAEPDGSRPELVVVASSGDNRVDGTLRIYDLAAGSCWEMPFVGGHGVLWDPGTSRLWALGTGLLCSYALSNHGPTCCAGWGLTDERTELTFRSIGHDLQTDYASGGTHVLVTTEETTLRASLTAPRAAHELVLPRGSDNVKSAARDRTGRLIWVRQQSYGHELAARYCDSAFTTGTLGPDEKHVSFGAAVHLPEGEWTYKLRPFLTDYL